MVHIEVVESLHVVLPPRRVHKWTGLTEPIGGYVLVRITGDNGQVGWGEAPVLKDWCGDYGRYFGETPLTAMQVIDHYLGPAVAGTEAANLVDLHERMDRAIPGYPYAKAAIDIAAYDLAGRSLGVPVYYLLGGLARRSVPVTHSIGLLSVEEAVQESLHVAKEGVRTLKLKIGGDVRRDVDVVRRVREAVGPEMVLCVDANRGYPSPREAIRAIHAMEPFNLLYVEQPVEGIRNLADVAHSVDTPLMADESAWTARDVWEIAEYRAAEIVSIYTTKPGGLHRAMEVAAVARAAGLRCNVNGSIETGVGNLANIQLAAAAPIVTLSCVVPVSTPVEAQLGQLAGIYYRDDLLAGPMTFSAGAIEVPEGPGMGIAVDEDKVARYRVTR